MKIQFQVLLFLGGALAAAAQEMPAPQPSDQSAPLSPAPEPPPPPPAAGRSPTSAIAEPANGAFMDASASAFFLEPTPGNAGPESPFHWGPVTLDPHLSYGLFYTNGILVSPGESADTTRQSFSPGFLAQFGPNWSLDYTPTWEEYSNRLFHDGFDQAARLDGKNVIGDWTLQFSQGYSRTDEPLVETGQQTPEQDYATDLRATYGRGGQTLLELGLDQDIQLSPVSPDSYEWSTLDWVHFPISRQLDVAAGGALGYVIMDPGYNMNFARPEGRIIWKPADRLTVDVQAGEEIRTFVGSQDPHLRTPVFNTTAGYGLWDGTSLTASAKRDVEAGYTEDQVDDTTTYSIGLQQRLLRHFYLGADVGRQDITYIAVGRSFADVRKDNDRTLQLTLSTVLFKRLSLEAEYSNVRNDSNLGGFGFLSNQYGLVIQYRY